MARLEVHPKNRWSTWAIPILLFLGALVVRFYHITITPFGGDELSIFRESAQFTNPNGILYFLGMRLWLSGGTALFWLRIPSVIFSALAVPTLWWWLRRIRPENIAILASVLLLIAPFAIEFSQEVRFYALFLFSSVLFMGIYWSYVSRSATASVVQLRIALFISAILLLGSHILGVLVVGWTFIHWLLFFFPPIKRRQKWALIFLLLLIVLTLLAVVLFPQVLQLGYQLVRRLNGSPLPSDYPGGRGFSFITIAKLGILYITLVFGQLVYPFEILVIISLGLAGILGLLGIVSLIRLKARSLISYAVFIGLGSIFALYFVFDTLWPASSRDSAAPRYLIYILPVFLWIVAEGIYSLRAKSIRVIALIFIVGTQLFGTVNYFYPTWNNSYKTINFAAAFDTLNSYAPNTLNVYTSGRANEPAKYFLDPHTPISYIWDAPKDAQFSAGKLAFLSLDDKEENRCPINSALSKMQGRTELFAWVNYPFFAYTYDVANSLWRSDNRISLPRAAYSLEFSDLRLPQQAQWQEKSYLIGGMYYLPNCNKETAIQIPNLEGVRTKSLLILSNLLRDDKLADGAPIAELTLITHDGSQETISLRKGYETQHWRGQCRECQAVLQWRKYIALLGNSAYPEAYQDFQAVIWGKQLQLSHEIDLKSLNIRLLEPSATFNIWGIYPQ